MEQSSYYLIVKENREHKAISLETENIVVAVEKAEGIENVVAVIFTTEEKANSTAKQFDEPVDKVINLFV